MIHNMCGGGAASSAVPEFTYSGTYEVLDDGDKNWRIRFLTSGKLVFTKAKSALKGIDVFLVGGGGAGGTNYTGGGGGGYTKTQKAVSVLENSEYTVTIGAGGSVNNSGGSSSAFGYSAEGGEGCGDCDTTGGKGGSGGGHYGNAGNYGGNGGSDGGAGAVGGSAAGRENYTGSQGQGTTTREFGESTGELYAGGGGGGTGTDKGGKSSGGAGGGGMGGIANTTYGEDGETNTGGGGGGGGHSGHGGMGGCGIVIIRNARG